MVAASVKIVEMSKEKNNIVSEKLQKWEFELQMIFWLSSLIFQAVVELFWLFGVSRQRILSVVAINGHQYSSSEI